MPFAAQYAAALLAVAFVLTALYYAMRVMRRGSLFGDDRRLVWVVESTPLQNNGALHVVRVGGAFYLVGANAGGISTLAELPALTMEEALKNRKTVRPDLPSPQ